MEFSAVFYAPVIETIAEQQVTLPILLCEDIAKLGSHLKTTNREAARDSAAESKLEGDKLYRVLQEVDTMEFTINAISRYIDTIPGATFVVNLSLEKGGYTEVSRKNILLALGHLEVQKLALQVSGFYGKKPTKPPAPIDPINVPLAEGASQKPTGSQSSPTLDEKSPE